MVVAGGSSFTKTTSIICPPLPRPCTNHLPPPCFHGNPRPAFDATDSISPIVQPCFVAAMCRETSPEPPLGLVVLVGGRVGNTASPRVRVFVPVASRPDRQ